MYGVLDKTAAWRTRQTLQQLDILPVTAVGDFLRGVRNIAIESMERTYGANWIRNAAIKYVLTIPAIWSDTACDLMVQAAEAAGFGTRRVDFHFVAEPEAAAAYTLKTMQQNTVKSGDFIVICDAGGGTVDLISYKIVETEPLKVVECVAGDGEFSNLFMPLRVTR